MLRLNQTLATAVVLLAVPSMASALGIQIVNVSSSSADPTFLHNGDTITFDLHLENNTNVPIAGLDVVVSGFDTPGTTADISSGLQLLSGQVAANAFSTAFEADPNNSDGITNQKTAPENIWAPNAQVPQPVRTYLFAGIDFANHNGDGSFDNGPFGQTGANGIHFRVTYRLVVPATAPGDPIVTASIPLTLSFGTLSSFGHVAIDRFGNEIPFSNASYNLTVIPEPGTALLMGLGLAGLALRRR